jgi:hypothetical protein
MNPVIYPRWALVIALLGVGCGAGDPSADGMGSTASADPTGSGGGLGAAGSIASAGGGGGGIAAGGREGSADEAGSGGRASSDGGVRPSDAASYDGPIGVSGVWTNVTPASVNLSSLGACGNYGAESVQSDAARPGDMYTMFMCQGVWKSSDYGQTWKGPVNTGNNGSVVGDCAGAIKMAPNNTATPPTLFASCIRGAGLGFWRSTNGGVDWTRYTVAPAGTNQQFYPPAVDPYDPNHLLMTGHGFDLLAQSLDGGQTWSAVKVETAMNSNGGTGGINFIDTGNATTTRSTWLWMGSDTVINIGTWRTSDGGAAWTKVETNDHPGGVSEIYQPDTNGVVYMPGVYSKLGHGVFRSTDYGLTWTHVGQSLPERVVLGTKKHMYALYGAASGPGQTVNPNLELSAQPGTATWTQPGTPAGMTQGPAQAVVVDVGASSVIVLANYNAGLWRYVEPN